MLVTTLLATENKTKEVKMVRRRKGRRTTTKRKPIAYHGNIRGGATAGTPQGVRRVVAKAAKGIQPSRKTSILLRTEKINPIY